MAITLRFYEELNNFLPRSRRKRSYRVACTEPRSVKDLIESQGVPHTEVDLILINGMSATFDDPVRDGDRVAVYPMFERLDITSASRLGRPPLRDIRFVADVHVGKLARRLRLLGFDCLYDPGLDDAQLALVSAREKRILLSRDVGLLKRAMVTHGIYLHSDDPAEQMTDVIRRLDLRAAIDPMSRCLRCNGRLEHVRKADVAASVPEKTLRHIDQYLRCTGCGKAYWKGTHWERLKSIIDQARSA